MNNLNLVRGLCLIVISLAFGTVSLTYKIGDFSRAGPGLFPLVVSVIVFLIGISTVVRARFVTPVKIDYNFKNISLVLLGLCGFAVISEHLNMILGIIFLVFCVSFAGKGYSVIRNLKISAGLIAIAFMFKHLLGLQLPLFS
jgi:Tripartite tricarboxylate transporter TctB family